MSVVIRDARRGQLTKLPALAWILHSCTARETSGRSSEHPGNAAEVTGIGHNERYSNDEQACVLFIAPRRTPLPMHEICHEWNSSFSPSGQIEHAAMRAGVEARDRQPAQEALCSGQA